MMPKMLRVLACVGLVACAFPKPADDVPDEQSYGGGSASSDSTQPEQGSTTGVMGPDGTGHWLVVKCGAAPECYQRASVTCPMGWSVYDKDKSTAYQVTGQTNSSTVGVVGGGFGPLGGGKSFASQTTASYSGQMLPVEHGEMLVKCGSEQNDAKLLDQLAALCQDGNEKACRAREFAVKKRGCCAWNQGARSCNEDHHVVCFDGHVSEQCSC
jgi:hypothetical protein